MILCTACTVCALILQVLWELDMIATSDLVGGSTGLVLGGLPRGFMFVMCSRLLCDLQYLFFIIIIVIMLLHRFV